MSSSEIGTTIGTTIGLETGGGVVNDRKPNQRSNDDEPLVRLLESYARGEIGEADILARPALDPRLRMYVALTALALRGRQEEFEAELQRALRAGLSGHAVREILLHLADEGIRAPDWAFDVARQSIERGD
jgi:alkylhydroperoxidase/carboxymuconolactone decarboxylase family protein YurZ